MMENLAKMLFVVSEGDPDDIEGDFDYRGIGTSWFDESALGRTEQWDLARQGGRDANRGLVQGEDGIARSPYLDMLHADYLARVCALAQLRHSQISRAQEKVGCLKRSLSDDGRRLEELEAAAAAASEGACGDGEGRGGLSGAHPSEAAQLRRKVQQDGALLGKLEARCAFLRTDARIKARLLSERYLESAFHYLRGAECTELQPPDLMEEAQAILDAALGPLHAGEAPADAADAGAPCAEAGPASAAPADDAEAAPAATAPADGGAAAEAHSEHPDNGGIKGRA